MIERWQFHLKGVVQGIGLRPMLFQLAQEYALTGWVQNTHQEVKLVWQAQPINLQAAVGRLKNSLAQYGDFRISQVRLKVKPEQNFTIKKSSHQKKEVQSLISPDLATCKACLMELFDPANRRYGYPFITCAQCGPRFTISHQLPYDRQNTTMANFTLCPLCQQEYEDPTDRRFHAQSIACKDCGPQLTYCNTLGEVSTQALNEAIKALQGGLILAVKGIGGFHLLLRASDTEAVKRLRERKLRPAKPFALMAKDIFQVQEFCQLSSLEMKLLDSRQAPIVLVKKKINQEKYSISPLVAPQQDSYGVMLAYTPLHHLLLAALNEPLIATSANIKDDPICFENDEALRALAGIADGWLLHNRDICEPLEDSVIQVNHRKIQFLRRARGFIPSSIQAPKTTHSILALGGQLKNTLAWYHQEEIHFSAYLGDLSSYRTLLRFKTQMNKFLRQEERAEKYATIVTDSHPEYVSALETKHGPARTVKIQHHQAHIFAVMAEHKLAEPILGLAWDGAGLGDNHQIWGAETFYIRNAQVQHVATLYPFPLLGGNKAMTEPRRIAIALLHEIMSDKLWSCLPEYCLAAFTAEEKNLFSQLLNFSQQHTWCTSIGRIFDGISFLLGGVGKMTFEAQAALYLEQLVKNKPADLRYSVSIKKNDGTLTIDWRPLVKSILIDIFQGIKRELIAEHFHAWCVQIILQVASYVNCPQIILSGGVFQNKILTSWAATLLQQKGYQVYWSEQIPPNDSGLAIGQAFAAHYLKAL